MSDGHSKTLRPLRQYAHIILHNNDASIMSLEIDMSSNTHLLEKAQRTLQNIGISSNTSGNGYSLTVSIPPPTPEIRQNMIKQC